MLSRHESIDLISDVLPFGRLWYRDANAVANAVGYAQHLSRSHGAMIRVYDESGNVIETHEHALRFHMSRATARNHLLFRRSRAEL
jgi:hypothetical protein